MHGMLRWAENRCSLSQYNPAIVEEARKCYEQLGSKIAAPLMVLGAKEFEQRASMQGKETFCNEIVRRFPMAVH
ncbi:MULTISPECIES: hypothetical protein [Methylobacterium]|jgi:hypothetical protein|uniref:Uncharacterized protein n=1 Tax=Methylobacterium persicinum TaxID=374426 RepID=A0ABU0HSW8_9HYPH|nr:MULTISPECIES: hypothetical protein [Methylobacterium]MDQ0445401.1 hypothetical protein [Methylobacterium persicinum]MWV25171.1 hypothetical protein [Methylobacterium sp. 2A]